MPRGGSKAGVATEPSRARRRNRSAVRETDKETQDGAPEGSGSRRSARIRAINDQLASQQPHQQALEPRGSASSRLNATTDPVSERDIAPTKTLAKKGILTASESRKGRATSRSSKSKTIPKPRRKVGAKSNGESKKDPTSQTTPLRKGAKSGKAKESGPATGKPIKKAVQAKATSSDPPLGFSSELIPGDAPDQHDHREGFGSFDEHPALTQEALEELTRSLKSLDADRDQESTYTSGTTYSDPREEFNYKYGYLPPLDEEASRIITAIIKNPAAARKMARTGSDSQVLFKRGLTLRKVETEPSRSVDPRGEEIKYFNLKGFLPETSEQKTFCEHLWLRDTAKLNSASSEAIFQRTLMVSLIARHFLIYEKKVNGEQLLDFSAEEPWTCLPMPSQVLWNDALALEEEQKLLTQPKPDLAVCFKRNAVIQDSLWSSLPEAAKELACFENQNSGMSRIFHFLTMEAKNATTSLEDERALYQSLNNASQALNNFYEFFHDAGPTHRQIFFDKIRFFSVVANAHGILIRIHRAIEIPHDASRLELLMPDRPEYRLRFEYTEFARLTGENGFMRERVISAVKSILKYAVEELSGWISAAAKDLFEKLDKDLGAWRARAMMSFYRHGQPSPKVSKNTPRTSIATSKSGRASPLAQQLLNAKLRSVTQSFVEESTSGHITPNADNGQQNPQSFDGAKKRTIGQVETESPESEGSQLRGKRSRKAKSRL